MDLHALQRSWVGVTWLDSTTACCPWLLTMLVFLVVVTYWPPMALWLPNTLLR